MEATRKFDYEKLSRPEIATCLGVTEHDLINPNPDLVADLYTHLLIHLGFLKEENEQLAFEALAHFENPDYHVDSIRIVKLYNMIKEVLAALQCPKAKDFALADLLTPDTQRTEFFLGAILKFVLLREENLISISEVRDEIKDPEKQQKLEETLILQVKSEISNFNEVREREMAIIQKVDAKVAELHSTIMVLNRNQKSLRTTLKKLRDKTEEMDAKISSAQFTLSQNAQVNENLRSEIPQSPDKIQRALEEKKLDLEEASKAGRLVMQYFYEKTILLEVYSKVYKKISKHHQQVHAMKSQTT